jgi:hypothetical protein
MSTVFRHCPLGFTQTYLDLLELWAGCVRQGVERRRLREEARPTNLPQSSYEGGPPDSLEYPTCHTTICVCSVEPKGKVCPATMENRHTSKYMGEDQTCRRSIPRRRWPCSGEGGGIAVRLWPEHGPLGYGWCQIRLPTFEYSSVSSHPWVSVGRGQNPSFELGALLAGYLTTVTTKKTCQAFLH